MSRNGRVLVAMSGGVDSSVAAALLREQGYEAVGVFMRTGATEPAEPQACQTGLSLPQYKPAKTRGCCSAADATDARTVAARLGMPFYALNFRADFERLMDDFADEYVRGRTPNPCVRCNQWLKFGKLADYARVVDADWIATGHYAELRHEADPLTGTRRGRLFRSRDRRKDQSYVLFGVAADVLARTLFPLGEMTKEEVRTEARRLRLETHDKPESQDICFVPDGDYARVVETRRPGKSLKGDIRHVDGRTLGRHEGIGSFTIGQRKGVRVALGTPVFVTALDVLSGTVTVGPREALRAGGLIAADVNWLTNQLPATTARGDCDTDACMRAFVQIRYHHTAVSARVAAVAPNAAHVTFDEWAEAVTPGQAAVFYSAEEEVLGGGWIEKAIVAA